MERANWRTPLLVLIASTLLGILTAGIRQTFGLYLRPMSEAFGWGREVFAFAVALQYLLWGALTPFTGAIAERWGTGRVVFTGGLFYAAGVYGMGHAATPLWLSLTLGLLIAVGVSAAGVSVALGAVARAAPEHRRSLYLGIVLTGSSFGMFIMAPIGQWLIAGIGWQRSLDVLAAAALLMCLAAIVVQGRPAPATGVAESPMQALRLACRERRFWLLFWGFFVCGFHVFFIATHLPAFLVDRGIGAGLGAIALSLIGLFNIFGSLLSGYAGGRWSKRYGLSTIYLLRGAVIGTFVAVPLSAVSVVVFSAAIGLLWLSTVPLTTGLVGQMYGVRYLSTVYGVVFFGHQIGGFLGVWLGGYLFDRTGSYSVMWTLSIALAIFGALIHLPIDERSPEQRAAALQTAPEGAAS